MKARLVGLLTLSVFLWSGMAQTQSNSKTTATGQAIGNGVKGFLDAAFPTASTLLNLVQGWLSKKLDNKQQQQVQKGAEQKQKEIDPKVKAAKDSIQNAADTMKLASVVLYRTNKTAAEVTAMLAILDTTRSDAKLPFSRLSQQWNDVKGELTALKENDTLQKARAAITDTAVSNALQGLDDVTRGPVSTISENMKPEGGDRDIVRQELNRILSATVDFDNLGVVLLGSTGIEITHAISNINVAGGGSSLDQDTVAAISNASKAVPQPSPH